MQQADSLLTALVANQNGEIFELDGFAAVGLAKRQLVLLSEENTAPMPHGSELMYLPDRFPILYNISKGEFQHLFENPYHPGEPIYPVSVFNSPGYVVSAISAYGEREGAGFLPLFSYGAAGWYHGEFRSAVFLIDPEKRQDLRLMPRRRVVEGIRAKRRQMPHNRLCLHLESCAQIYGCPAAKNFFLQRFEAPLPTAKHCNARCRGCLSRQIDDDIHHSQDRIDFTPSPKEIAEVAVSHIQSVKHAVVSFGQGCEGEPLLAGETIVSAIRRIRHLTRKGTINMNTNGSRPVVLERLIDAGLDSIRVSLNSLRAECYNAYFRPKDYRFSDVVQGIDVALRQGIHVSLNYIHLPGFTDVPQEVKALVSFIRQHPIQMIQWRNLNYDPVRYWKLMGRITSQGEGLGMHALVDKIRDQFPYLHHGYFNPPKELFKSAK
jgi:pyruvate-formate lyase-activating enzyme